jgi:hypothetical protein
MHQLLDADTPVRGAYMISVPSSSAPFLRTAPKNNGDLVQSFAGACDCANGTVAQSVDCLRTVDTAVMVNRSAAWEGSGTGLGGVVKQNVFSRLQQDAPSVPVVVSACRDEGTNQAIGFNSSSDAVTSIAIQSTPVPLLKTYLTIGSPRKRS